MLLMICSMRQLGSDMDMRMQAMCWSDSHHSNWRKDLPVSFVCITDFHGFHESRCKPKWISWDLHMATIPWWGQSLENHMCWPLWLIRRVCEAWSDKPLFVRISGMEWAGDEQDDGMSRARFLAQRCRRLELIWLMSALVETIINRQFQLALDFRFIALFDWWG